MATACTGPRKLPGSLQDLPNSFTASACQAHLIRWASHDEIASGASLRLHGSVQVVVTAASLSKSSIEESRAEGQEFMVKHDMINISSRADAFPTCVAFVLQRQGVPHQLGR